MLAATIVGAVIFAMGVAFGAAMARGAVKEETDV